MFDHFLLILVVAWILGSTITQLRAKKEREELLKKDLVRIERKLDEVLNMLKK